jgi:glycosyltransferase involved in cell wall biosynthesis
VRLDVFILSYNRAEFLRETLESFAAQTLQDFRLIVLDNASTDHTPHVVNEFSKQRAIRFHQNPSNIGFIDNFLQVGTLAEADWVMAFHDDDILHPLYLEYAMAALDQNSRCRLVASNYTNTSNPSLKTLSAKNPTQDNWAFTHAANFASFCFTLNKVHFGSAIYHRDSLRKITKEQLNPFGKIADRPVMIETLRQGGEAVVFKFPFVQYRLHASQDSQSPDSGPFLREAIHLTRFYSDVMGQTWSTSSGRSFLVNNRAYLRGLYKWCSDRHSRAFELFVCDARRTGAATCLVHVPRLPMRLLKKLLLRLDSAFF